jgi:hypothetical protein
MAEKCKASKQPFSNALTNERQHWRERKAAIKNVTSMGSKECLIYDANGMQKRNMMKKHMIKKWVPLYA